MKVLWVGDAACSSGFARCTHAACDALHAGGHDVAVLGINYYGDPHQHAYPIYPCYQPLDNGRDGFGVARLPTLVQRLEPEVVVLLNDPWNVPAYMGALRAAECDTPVVAWLAVDAKNQRGEPLNDLAHVITWTDFAMDELRAGGYEGPGSVVPLGVDGERFYPRDRAESRTAALPEGVSHDAFIVGVVGRNQPRKRLDLTIAYFAAWLEQDGPPDAYLYLHVAPTGDRGFDLHSLVKYHGLEGRVVLSEPHIGIGVPDEDMSLIYSAFDLYLSTTQGEGWGLPCLEAMACGVPCIVPDWSALGEWPGHAAFVVPCSTTAISAPLNSLAYTVGGVPDKAATVRALSAFYVDAKLRGAFGSRGMQLASQPEFQWATVGTTFCRVLESALEPRLRVVKGVG